MFLALQGKIKQKIDHLPRILPNAVELELRNDKYCVQKPGDGHGIADLSKGHNSAQRFSQCNRKRLIVFTYRGSLLVETSVGLNYKISTWAVRSWTIRNTRPLNFNFRKIISRDWFYQCVWETYRIVGQHSNSDKTFVPSTFFCNSKLRKSERNNKMQSYKLSDINSNRITFMLKKLIKMVAGPFFT